MDIEESKYTDLINQIGERLQKEREQVLITYITRAKQPINYLRKCVNNVIYPSNSITPTISTFAIFVY